MQNVRCCLRGKVHSRTQHTKRDAKGGNATNQTPRARLAGCCWVFFFLLGSSSTCCWSDHARVCEMKMSVVGGKETNRKTNRFLQGRLRWKRLCTQPHCVLSCSLTHSRDTALARVCTRYPLTVTDTQARMHAPRAYYAHDPASLTEQRTSEPRRHISHTRR